MDREVDPVYSRWTIVTPTTTPSATATRMAAAATARWRPSMTAHAGPGGAVLDLFVGPVSAGPPPPSSLPRRAASELLRGRADEDLVERHPPRPRDREGDDVGDVLGRDRQLVV